MGIRITDVVEKQAIKKSEKFHSKDRMIPDKR
jgi:hypothetical protein